MTVALRVVQRVDCLVGKRVWRMVAGWAYSLAAELAALMVDMKAALTADQLVDSMVGMKDAMMAQ
jgi:hypothetical protein